MTTIRWMTVMSLFVPVFGTAVAAYLLAGMKLSSAALLAVGRHFMRAA